MVAHQQNNTRLSFFACHSTTYMRTTFDATVAKLLIGSHGEVICMPAGVPITFDFHHHRFCDGGLTEEQAFKAAIATWPKGVRPQVTSLFDFFCQVFSHPAVYPVHWHICSQRLHVRDCHANIMFDAVQYLQRFLARL